MKKRELLHCHALLMAVARECVDRGALPEESLAPYHDIDVTPMSLQGRREDHAEAVLTLARLLAAELDGEPEGAELAAPE